MGTIAHHARLEPPTSFDACHSSRWSFFFAASFCDAFDVRLYRCSFSSTCFARAPALGSRPILAPALRTGMRKSSELIARTSDSSALNASEGSPFCSSFPASAVGDQHDFDEDKFLFPLPCSCLILRPRPPPRLPTLALRKEEYALDPPCFLDVCLLPRSESTLWECRRPSPLPPP